MTKHMFIIPLMALSIAGAADTASAVNGRTAAANQESRSSLPNLNIEAACQDVAKNDLNKTTDYPGCNRKSGLRVSNCRRSGLRIRQTCTSDACLS